MKGTTWVALAAVCAVTASESLRADAQRLNPTRPNSFVVGEPRGDSPMFRGNARRTGVTPQLLPQGSLRVAWRAPTLGGETEQPVLVGAGGAMTVVTLTPGEGVFFLGSDGVERSRRSGGTASAESALAGPATLSSDGTVVFTSSAGNAVGLRGDLSRPRFVTPLGSGRNRLAAPLSLDDGGTVVATSSELVTLDAEGTVRARTALPEPAAAPLLSDGDEVIAISAKGVIYGWRPGQLPLRLGSFGGTVDGGAALADAHMLLAVVEGQELVAVNLQGGERTVRAAPEAGLFFGPPSVRGVPGGGTAVTLMAYVAPRAFVVTFDAAGRETARSLVASARAPEAPDGGIASLAVPSHCGTLIDERGAVAFAGVDGRVGIVRPNGTVELLDELICAKPPRPSGILGLSAVDRDAFAVTCESGVVAKVVGDSTARRPGPSNATHR